MDMRQTPAPAIWAVGATDIAGRTRAALTMRRAARITAFAGATGMMIAPATATAPASPKTTAPAILIPANAIPRRRPAPAIRCMRFSGGFSMSRPNQTIEEP